MGRVPEDLVEEPQVGPEGVIGHVPQDREDAVEDEVRQDHAGDNVGFEPNRQTPDGSDHEREL